MAAPYFLNSEEFLEVLLNELPGGVYANDRADDPDPNNRSVSSSELRTIAEVLAGLSENLNLIFDDKFLSTVTQSGLGAYEQDYFTTAQDSTLPLGIRQQNILAKIRSTGGISLPAIQSVVAGILGQIPFDLLPYSGQAGVGAWVLGASLLGAGTWLAQLDPIFGARVENGLTPLDCNLNYAAEGLTANQLSAIQGTAYVYEVRIYGNADANTLALLDARLTGLEPARSTHIIRNNQMAPSGDFSAYIAATPQYARMRLS